MSRCVYAVGAVYPIPGHLIFVLGGRSAERPVVSRSAQALFRKYRQHFHVYEVAPDFASLRLAIASEGLEEEIGEALPKVALTALQSKRLERAVRRAIRRRRP